MWRSIGRGARSAACRVRGKRSSRPAPPRCERTPATQAHLEALDGADVVSVGPAGVITSSWRCSARAERRAAAGRTGLLHSLAAALRARGLQERSVGRWDVGDSRLAHARREFFAARRLQYVHYKTRCEPRFDFAAATRTSASDPAPHPSLLLTTQKSKRKILSSLVLYRESSLSKSLRLQAGTQMILYSNDLCSGLQSFGLFFASDLCSRRNLGQGFGAFSEVW